MPCTLRLPSVSLPSRIISVLVPGILSLVISSGGVALAKPPKKITIQDVLEALDAGKALEDRCVLGMDNCSDRDACPFHDQWGRFKEGIATVARKTTLAQLAES